MPHPQEQPHPRTLQCLSLRQPWAWLVCAGVKTVANRTGITDHRGMLAIHGSAAKQDVNDVAKQLCARGIDPAMFVFDNVVGTAELVDVVEMNEQLETNPSASGPFCWIFANARLLTMPVPFEGKLHLYELPTEIAAPILSGANAGVQPSSRIAEACNEVANERLAGQIHVSRAQSYFDRRHHDDAIRSCDRALAFNPDLTHVYCLRGASLGELGRTKEALADFNAAIQTDLKGGRAFYMRSIYYRQMGDTAKADADYAKAVEMEPSIANADDAKAPAVLAIDV